MTVFREAWCYECDVALEYNHETTRWHCPECKQFGLSIEEQDATVQGGVSVDDFPELAEDPDADGQ